MFFRNCLGLRVLHINWLSGLNQIRVYFPVVTGVAKMLWRRLPAMCQLEILYFWAIHGFTGTKPSIFVIVVFTTT